jgi:succinyl-CoA synthetase alpha subunit
MSILIDGSTRLLVQGITGRMARLVTQDLISYGTDVAGGVSPGRGGSIVDGVPVFEYVADAVQETGANAVLVFVPPDSAAGAIDEDIDAGVPLIVYPGDGLPIADALRLRRRLPHGTRLVGPNTPGVISPGKSKVGFMPSSCFSPGTVGVISKSGSLSYEVSLRLSEAGIGQSTVVGVGGDPLKGLSIAEALALFHADEGTSSVLFLGEIGGLDEYQICEYLCRSDAKPVTAFIAGRSAPAGRRMGHASAIIGGPRETYAAKTQALSQAGAGVADSLEAITTLVRFPAATR